MIRIEQEAAIIRILLDRPDQRNAFSRALTEALANAVADAAEDDSCRLIWISSTSASFSAGRDLSDTAAKGRRDLLDQDEAWVRIFKTLHRASKPSLAVVEGYAVAGGFTLAMGCDFVLASREAKFGALEMQNDFPASVCTPILARLAGPRIAMELALFGDLVGAERLYELGLINALADDGAALAEMAEKYAARLTRLDPDALALTRETFRAAENMPLDNALDMGKHLNQFIAASGWFAEGYDAMQRRRGKQPKS